MLDQKKKRKKGVTVSFPFNILHDKVGAKNLKGIPYD